MREQGIEGTNERGTREGGKAWREAGRKGAQ